MEIARNLLLVLHLLGMAIVVGAWFVQLKAPHKSIPVGMLHGALTALVTGIALNGLAEIRAEEPLGAVFHAKMGVKLVIALAVVVLAWRGRRRETVSTGMWGAIGGLAILNVLIAVLVPGVGAS